jgi:cation-transporting ATPase I
VREELQDPLTPVLAVGAAASAIVGSAVDAVLVGAVAGGNALVSGAQRVRAEGAVRQLIAGQELRARRVDPGGKDARTLAEQLCRGEDGVDDLRSEDVPAKTLVPGDVIELRAPDVIPADARLVAVTDLEVDESTLTGESLPVDKQVAATPGVALADRACMVFEGTIVVAGTGFAVVVATGDTTQAGRATRAAGKAAPPAGVQARLVEVTRRALPATAIGGAAVTGLSVLRRVPLREAVAAGVSIAVAAVPEGLPLVATVAQAGAARRLSRRGVLVRSSRTLEALGRVDTVCFDKTGTLTEGRLSVARVTAPHGDLPDDPSTSKNVLTVAARACPRDDGDGATLPHATDRAVLEAAGGSNGEDEWELSTELAFETNRGYSASFGRLAGDPALALKGAPEVVLPLCAAVAADHGAEELTPPRRHEAEEVVKRLAADGLRVLAVAERRAELPAHADDIDPLVTDLTLLGFLGIADPPRPGARDAVQDMSEAGLALVMVTGDHPITARAVARAVGLPVERVVTGDDLDRMTEAQRVRAVAEASVFARVSPEQKVRIVESLRSAGRVVAMTGDGANDAAAIRLADVGIGVAAAGSTAARSAADLVLAEADLPRIHDALLAGRAMWQQVRDAVAILVGGNAGEVAFMVIGTALSGRAPLGVRQLLLVNMLTDMFPALAVAVSPNRDSEPTTAAGSSLGEPLARAVAVRGAATALGATAAWAVGSCTGRRRRASSMGLAALIGTQLGQTLLTGWHSPLVVATSSLSALALFAVVETPGVSQFFGCTPMGPVAWSLVFGCAAGATVVAALAPRVLTP